MILLDTCTLLWLVDGQQFLSKKAIEVIRENKGSLFVSSVSAFEITLKYHKKRLTLPFSPLVWFQKALLLHGLEEVGVQSKIFSLSIELPPLHNDPADRILIATALDQNLTLLTPDHLIHSYPKLNWVW